MSESGPAGFLRECRWECVRRGFRYAAVVGTVLIVINHGSALLHGDVTAFRVVQMMLTALVPFLVSTLSSVAATRAQLAIDPIDQEPET